MEFELKLSSLMENTSAFENASEQQLYAKIVYHMNHLGLFALVAGFALYLTGMLTPHVPLEDLPQYWSLPLEQYLEKTGALTGWQWISELGYGDVAPLLGVAVLASITLVCYLVLFFQFLQRGIKPLVVITVIELFFMLLSASNLIQISH
ncbi:MAG TPA: hypothetical protein DEA86_02660 [Deltaproteobacteria bacterium]|nr:hypothetical protein [Deltaproteobacteria bacterium]HBR59358.1 hypothetical protein [Deltaproteobacteria bacterium]HCV45589.1 hypothetical protein [Deltaproteobacteria bacterium]